MENTRLTVNLNVLYRVSQKKPTLLLSFNKRNYVLHKTQVFKVDDRHRLLH